MAGISRLRVVIINAHYPDYEAEREILASFGATVEHVDAGADPVKIAAAARDADAVMTRETRIPADAIAGMTRCKVIVRYGVGVDNIDLAAARARGICVANVPDYGSVEVASHALALLMGVSRRLVQRDRAVRNGVWGVGAAEKMYSLQGRTLGIVGYGRIGRAFRQLCSGLGFGRTLVCDPFVTRPEDGTECVDLDTLCRESDVISLHAPMTRDNYHLIGAERLAMMKPTAILINTSRGGLVDEPALALALQTGKLFGAGIDVYEKEPPGTAHPFFGLANVIVTDHTGWYSEESLKDLQRKAAQEVARVFAGERPHSWVNRWED